MTIRVCSHRRLLLPMQSDVLNEQQQSQQQLSNDNDCSSSLSTTTTLIYSGLKLHPKPLVPTISMPGVASPLSIVKKLPLPDSHLDNPTNSLRHSSSSSSSSNTTTTTSTPSSIRLVTPTGKSSPPFQITEKSSTNGTFSTSKTYILNPPQSSTTTVTKPSNSSSSSSSLLTLIPPGTTSPKIQTLNSVTISSTNDHSTSDKSSPSSSSSINSNQSVFLSKNRVTLVQPLITNSTSTSSTNASKIVTTNNHFWPTPSSQQTPTQATKIFSIPPSSILPTAKMLSRPVQLIPTSDHHHHHHHPHITHIQTVKSEKSDSTNSYPISMHFGLTSPTINENPFVTKTFDSSSHQPCIQMHFLPSTSSSESINSSQQQQQPVQLTFPTHVYSTPSSVLISTTQRSMDHNNNHQSMITTPIIREMQTEEKTHDSSTIKTLHPNKVSIKNRTRLPLQPSTQQTSLTLTSMTPASSSSSSTTTTTHTPTTIRQPKKHKLTDDEHISSNEPPKKLIHYEQFSNSRARPLSKFSIENTTPISLLNSSSTSVDSSGLTKKRCSAETANAAILSRKRRTMKKHHHHGLISNENARQEPLTDRMNPSSSSNIIIEQIDDELLKRLSQDFTYMDQRTGLRWIGTKTRAKSMSTLVSRFSWKPKINHYEKYSDIIRTNPKRTVPVKNLETIRQKLTEPWASWRIDRLTNYLSDLSQDEQMTVDELSDITHRLDIVDPTIRTTIEDLIEGNIQRHRCFAEQLNQISHVLVNLLDHGNTLRDLSKTSTTTKRTKEQQQQR